MSSAAAPTRRHEVKFTAPTDQRGHIELWLRTSSLALRPAYPDRRVHNVYFDTVDADALAEKLAGVSRRAKVRYRWYGEGEGIGAGRLEVKHRHNGVGWKEEYAVAEAPVGGTRGAWARALRQALPLAARRWLDDLAEPMLVNSYRRSYFVSADGRVRATVDRDLDVCDQRLGRFPQLRRRLALPPVLVLELKFATSERARVSAQLGTLGLVASACSKYELALRALAET